MTEPIGTRGMVYLVGAGPGDPGLLTLRGQRCLSRADVVLYDYLVNPRILQHAPQAEKICLGRHGHGRILSQEEINRLMVERAQAGKCVVRLKGGDPAVFAHMGEELAALAEAGVSYEVVPGITAALAVGSHAGIMLTHRDAASAVALVTGRECDGKDESAIDYAALADFPGTLVFYMGVTSAETWTRSLIAAGKSGATPAAIIRRCSWPDQQVFACTLQSVPTTIAQRRIRPPVVVVVGETVGTGPIRNWLSQRALMGLRILVTRPEHQCEELIDALAELGADVLLQPAIEIASPDDWSPVDTALSELERFDWIVFSSANGVRAFLDRLFQSGRDLRTLGRARLAAIGPGTADEMRRYFLTPDVVPTEFRAESLAAALEVAAHGKHFLLIRASRGREVLAQRLTAAGGHVAEIVAYQSRDVLTPDSEVMRLLQAGQIDWVTVSSSAIAHALVGLFGDALRSAKLASISPVTSATLSELGLPVAAEARQYTMDGLVAAIRSAAQRKTD